MYINPSADFAYAIISGAAIIPVYFTCIPQATNVLIAASAIFGPVGRASIPTMTRGISFSDVSFIYSANTAAANTDSALFSFPISADLSCSFPDCANTFRQPDAERIIFVFIASV